MEILCGLQFGINKKMFNKKKPNLETIQNIKNYFINKNYNIKIICSKISPEIRKKINKKIKIVICKNFIFLPFIPIRILNSINAFICLLFFYNSEKNQIILSMQDHPFAIIASRIRKIPCVIRIANHPNGSLKFYNNFIKYFIKINIKKIFSKCLLKTQKQ